MPLTIKNKFNIGDFVYLSSDADQYKGLIVFIQINPNGLMYGVSYAGEISLHFEIELSLEKAVV